MLRSEMRSVLDPNARAGPRLRSASAALLAIALCSCVPASVTYHEASAPGMREAPGRGSGRARAFYGDGIVLTVAVTETYPSDFREPPAIPLEAYFTIRLTVRLEAGRSAAFVDDELEWWSTTGSGEPKKLELSSMRHNAYSDGKYSVVYTDPLERMAGVEYELGETLLGPFVQDRIYATGARIEKSAVPDRFQVRLPSIRMGESVIDYPVVSFEKVKELLMIPLLGS